MPELTTEKIILVASVLLFISILADKGQLSPDHGGLDAQQFLNFLPLPQGQGSFLSGLTCFTTWFSLFLIQFITFAGARFAFSSLAMKSMYGSTCLKNILYPSQR